MVSFSSVEVIGKLVVDIFSVRVIKYRVVFLEVKG